MISARGGVFGRNGGGSTGWHGICGTRKNERSAHLPRNENENEPPEMGWVWMYPNGFFMSRICGGGSELAQPEQTGFLLCVCT
jgi:hypothetical protein